MAAKQTKQLRPLDWAFDQLDMAQHAMMLVLLVMARRGNVSFHCHMTIERIARETLLCPVTVRRTIKLLIAAGKIAECVPKRMSAGRVRQFRLLVPGATFGPQAPQLLSPQKAKTYTQNLKPSESKKNQAASAAGLPGDQRRKSSTYGPVQIGHLIGPAMQLASTNMSFHEEE